MFFVDNFVWFFFLFGFFENMMQRRFVGYENGDNAFLVILEVFCWKAILKSVFGPYWL